ncbi:hypothetical protein BGZ83_001322, partial [Gryganskiella cystojenkinii]
MDTPCSKTPPKITPALADGSSAAEEEDTDIKDPQIDDVRSLSADLPSEEPNPSFASVKLRKRAPPGTGGDPAHPWEGLCVSLGTHCGSGLFGYSFTTNGIYKCDQIGVKPIFIKNCNGGCNFGICESETSKPQCIPLIKPIKDLLRQTITTIEGLPLSPEASKLLKIAVGTSLSAYFDNGVDSAGATAAVLAATIPQIVTVIKATQASLGGALDIEDPAFQVLYGILGEFTKVSADLAACTGANVDCTGLVVLSGYAIKIALPIVRAYLTVKFPPAALALLELQPTIDKTADDLITGNDAGLASLISMIFDATTGAAGNFLPQPLKAILSVTQQILEIIKSCNNTTGSIKTSTLGLPDRTTDAPIPTDKPTMTDKPTSMERSLPTDNTMDKPVPTDEPVTTDIPTLTARPVPTEKTMDQPVPTDKPVATDEPTSAERPVPTVETTEKPLPTDNTMDKPVPTEKPVATDKPTSAERPVPTDNTKDKPVPTERPVPT